MKNILWLFLVFVLDIGCSSSSKVLDKYPTAEIDRPYTLPYGANSWVVSSVALPGASPIVNPFYWEQSLSNDWTLVWVPAPFAAKYQAIRNEHHRLGVNFGTLFLASWLGVDYRYKLNADGAINLGLDFSNIDLIVYATKSATLSLGYLYQINSAWSVKPSLGLTKGQIKSDIINIIFSGVFGTNYKSTWYDFTSVSYGLDFTYNFSKQWNFSGAIGNLNYDGGIKGSANFATFRLTHLWD